MSHSKMNKRGQSLFVEKWNKSAKRFIVTCAICGKQGYDPTIDENGFIHSSESVTNYEHRAIWAELTSIYSPLPLDGLGRCEICASLTDKQ